MASALHSGFGAHTCRCWPGDISRIWSKDRHEGCRVDMYRPRPRSRLLTDMKLLHCSVVSSGVVWIQFEFLKRP